MRITADTNVLLSATFWTGNSFRILKKVEQGEIELTLSEEILEEYSRVLEYKDIQQKIKNKNLEMRMTVEELIAMSILIEPKEKIDLVKDDPDDNVILECAIAGKADYIVTQDNHLLKLKEYRGIKIVKPEEFMKLM